MKKPFAHKLRRKIAGWILGDDLVLYSPTSISKLANQEGWTAIPDEAVGKFYKYVHAMVIKNVEEEREPSFSYKNMMISQAVLYLADYADRMGAQEAEFSVKGTIDGGESVSSWAVRLDKIKDIGPWKEPVVTRDGEKITHLSMSFDNQGYKWKNREESEKVDK